MAVTYVTPSRVAQQYFLALEDAEDLEQFNESVIACLNFGECRHVQQGLWPAGAVQGMSETCVWRCGNCIRRADGIGPGMAGGYEVNVHEVARTLVGTQGKRDKGLLGEMDFLAKETTTHTFKNIVNYYSATLDSQSDTKSKVPTAMVPFAVLLVCAYGFLKPTKNPVWPTRHNVLFKPHDYSMLKRLYSEAEIKGETVHWLPMSSQI